MTDTALLIKDVDKFYGPVDYGVHAVKKLNMDVRKGEIIALLGSSGCGKTSTLRMIAGFEAVSRGTISLAGKEVQTLPPVRRNVAVSDAVLDGPKSVIYDQAANRVPVQKALLLTLLGNG